MMHGIEEAEMTDAGIPAVRALIFDFDGTLADTMPTHYRAWHNTVTRYGLVFTEQRFYIRGGWSTRRIAEMLISEAGSTLSPARLVEEKEAEFQRLTTHVQPIEPVVDIARKTRGLLPMAVATSGLRKIVQPILESLKLSDWFDTLVTADDVVNAKPAPDIFLEAARRLNVPPEQCRVYEDTDAGIEAAQRAGMPYVDVRQLLRLGTPT